MKALALLSLILLLAVPIPAAHATDRDLKTVINTGAYGMLAGTAAGLIAWPITKSERAVFIGTSLGLYLGIAAGIYHVLNRDAPGNPLRAGAIELPATPYEALPQAALVEVSLVRF